MKKLIIFDYDGVIVNSFPFVHKVYQSMCERLGKNCPESFEDFKKTYGGSSTECYANLGFTDEEILQGNSLHKEEMSKLDVPIIEGIKDVVRTFSKKYDLMIISSANQDIVEENLEKNGLSQYFKEIVGRKDVGLKRLNKTEEIKKAVDKYSAENIISIGDRNVDFIEGNNVGLKNILLVDFGWGYDLNKIPEYKKKFDIKYPSDLLEAVNRIFE